jgi:hypothetical protein
MDDKTTTIAEIKKKIGDAEIEEAIRQLISYLEENPSYRNLHSDALQALSRYRKTKREAAQGIITYDQAKLDYNQVTNLVLNILETLQREAETGRPAHRRWPLIAGVLALVLVLGGGAFWYLSGRSCPVFDPESQEFGILLFPFYNPNSDKIDERIPNLMRTRFEEFGAHNELHIIPCIPKVPSELKNPPSRIFFPTTDAEKLGKEYRARLVIWGAYEEDSPQKMEATTRYKFLYPEQEDGFQMSQLSFDENTEVQEITSPIKIATDGELTGNIEAAILRWFSGIIAHESGNYQAAISSLKDLEVPTDSAGLVRDMVLADSYLKMDEKDNAINTYDNVLKQHPNYWLGWHNRGVLYLQKGDYQQAIKDLNRRIELNPNDAKSLFARGEAYLQLDQLQKARQDFETAQKLPPKDSTEKLKLQPLIKKRLETVERTIDSRLELQPSALEREN